jgi:transposase
MNSSTLVPDALWEAIEPLLPKKPPNPEGGRPQVPDRAALGGIVFVLRTGCPWRLLPKELACNSGTTCWRRLRDWQEAGVWERQHTTLINWLGDEAAVDWSRASVDTLSVRAKRGRADLPEPGRPGQIRLQVPPGCRSAQHSPGRSPLGGQCPRRDPPAAPGRRDSLNHWPSGKPGRPRKRPAKLHADTAHDSSALRRALRARGITTRLARREIDSSERLGRSRWVVERTLSWLLDCRRLGVR